MPITGTSEGTVAVGLEPVRDAFEENFRSRSDVGAAFSAYLNGTKVVDIWGGDAAPGRPWDERTLVLAFSVAKGITAFVMELLAERGIYFKLFELQYKSENGSGLPASGFGVDDGFGLQAPGSGKAIVSSEA